MLITNNKFAFFLFITVTYESINVSSYDLGLVASLSSLALDKHTGMLPGYAPTLECEYGVGDVDGLHSD